VPTFIASDPKWANQFIEKNLPIIGDDVKSQVGATIVHRVLANLFRERGVRLDRTYQINMGGNSDFLNMLERSRLSSKKKSKTDAVQSQLETDLPPDQIHVGPSDHIPWLKDHKICKIRMEGTTFGNMPLRLDVDMEVVDSPNSAGVVIDAIRICKIALDRKIGGPLMGPSAYLMKSPPTQYSDAVARVMSENFIQGVI
jgi:myo-inositol-1-phosphate synthase